VNFPGIRLTHIAVAKRAKVIFKVLIISVLWPGWDFIGFKG
jgi:hypothetical protein